jgi:putative sigma-54 modulation protein
VQVKISARHGQLDDSIQQQLLEKGEKLLHFFNRLTMIEIMVDLHKERAGKMKVEIVATAEHDHEFVGCDEDTDVMHAFTRALAHVKQQITHHKEKIQDHRRDPSHGNNSGA